jgi:leader peptidase (prepilin peptidase)/N-methyltransferase
VSFVVQVGRCRGCKGKIALQYPVVEILSGLIMATIPQVLGMTPFAFVWAAALLILLAASFIDARNYVIPDVLTVAIALLGIVSTAMVLAGRADGTALVPGTFLGSYAYVFSFTQNPVIAHIAAAAAGGIFFSMVILFSRGKAMGWGDAKLAAAVGLMIGWPDAIMALMIAFIIGAVAGIFALVSKKKKLKDALPFGPFIAIGTATVVYFGYDIISAYFKFLNLAA